MSYLIALAIGSLGAGALIAIVVVKTVLFLMYGDDDDERRIK